MNESLEEILANSPIEVCVIDYIGKMEDGVGILINLMVDETTFEVAFWFNGEGKVRLVPEDKLLEFLEVEDIYKYENINELIYLIYSKLPNPDAILSEFLK